MPDYRACIIGSDGHFYKSVALDALDDAAAIEAAKQLVDGHDVELWQFDRKIGKFGQEKTLNIWAAPSADFHFPLRTMF